MSDDHNSRSYRAHDLPGRSAPRASNTPAGNDPLAELARLIGQSDPFGEFRRSAGQTQPESQQQQPQHQPRPQFQHQPETQFERAAPPHEPYGTPAYARQPYGSAPLADEGDFYPPQGNVPGYPPQPAGAAYEQYDHYDPNEAGPGPEEMEYYDAPPPRRRMGILAIAAVFALAVIGTAGAFGYRALFGSSPSGPPPVIKADPSPSKIVPDKKDTASNKLINDRVTGDGQAEKLVSREEQPVEIKPAGVFPPAQAAPGGSMQQQPPLGSGVIAGAGEPKKIRTIVIRPDQPGTAGSAGSAAQPPAPQPQGDTTGTPSPRSAAPSAPSRVASADPTADPEPAPAARHAEPRASRAASASSNAPLSLSPDAAPAAPPPARTASAPTRIDPPAARSSGAGGYAVQLSSRRSEAEATAAFRSLKAKFPSQLGSSQPMIRKVDLGKKGIYYRAMVGPFGSSDEASRMCSSLKAAGGSCFVQRI